jgi:hypothetical protein
MAKTEKATSIERLDRAELLRADLRRNRTPVVSGGLFQGRGWGADTTRRKERQKSGILSRLTSISNFCS